MGLSFASDDRGGVSATFACEPHYQGYPDRLHGGVVATLLDAAMTNCLFARGVRGMTARLNIRFRHPLEVGGEAVVRAWLIKEWSPLYVLKAEVTQGGKVRAVADAKFYGEPAPAS